MTGCFTRKKTPVVAMGLEINAEWREVVVINRQLEVVHDGLYL